jgi:hypothetical protein
VLKGILLRRCLVCQGQHQIKQRDAQAQFEHGGGKIVILRIVRPGTGLGLVAVVFLICLSFTYPQQALCQRAGASSVVHKTGVKVMMLGQRRKYREVFVGLAWPSKKKNAGLAGAQLQSNRSKKS